MRLCGQPRLRPSVANRFAVLFGRRVVHKAFLGPASPAAAKVDHGLGCGSRSCTVKCATEAQGRLETAGRFMALIGPEACRPSASHVRRFFCSGPWSAGLDGS
jgi:hypothetical protein